MPRAQKKTTQKRTPGRPSKTAGPGLTRERVIEAALLHVDAHGVDSLGIRKLASELGVAPNSLYWYVRDKDDLIDGVVDSVFGKLEVPPPTAAEWTERLREVCLWFRGELLKHPNVVAAPGFRRTFPFGLLPLTYAAGEILAEAGYDGEELVYTCQAVFYHTIGFVTLEVGRARHGVPTRSDEAILERVGVNLGETRMAEAGELLPLAREMDLDAVFALSLDALLEGLAARRRSS